MLLGANFWSYFPWVLVALRVDFTYMEGAWCSTNLQSYLLDLLTG